jgi:hypothetical protein
VGILMIRARKPGVPFLPADTSKLLLSALAQCFLGHCDAPHEWFAGDAWVCESDEDEHGRQHFDTSA